MDLVIINLKLVKKLKLKIYPIKEQASHRLGMCVANRDSTQLKSWIKFCIEVARIRRELYAFVTPKDNPNISLLLELLWLWSVDAKLFIQEKEIHIGNIKKREVITQILCSTTFSKKTQFEASCKNQINKDKSSKETDIDSSNIYNSDEKSEKDLSDQDFENV